MWNSEMKKWSRSEKTGQNLQVRNTLLLVYYLHILPALQETLCYGKAIRYTDGVS